MSATTLPAFTFEGSNVRVFMINNEPWFAATDVARCIGIKDPKDAVKNLRSCERSGFKPERGGSLTIISESGMYTMVLRSDAAIKEGTAAFRFRVWVTDEVLPAIRKTGTYTRTSVPAQSPIGQAIAPAIAVSPITDVQYAELTAAVRAKASGSDRSAAYSRLRARFRVVSLRQIPEARFQEALEWVRQYRVPVKALPAPKTTTGRPVLTHDIGEARGLKMMSGVKAIIGIGDDGLPFAQVIKNQVLVCPTSAEHICAMLELVPDAVIPDILRICTNRIAGMRRLTN